MLSSSDDKRNKSTKWESQAHTSSRDDGSDTVSGCKKLRGRYFFHRSEAILKAGGFVSAFCCARPAVLFQTARWLESANMLQQIAGVRKSNMLLKCMCIRDAEFESEFAPNLIHEGQVLRNQTVEIWNLRSERERNWIEEVMVWPTPAYFRLRKLSKKERRDFKNAECRSDQITKFRSHKLIILTKKYRVNLLRIWCSQFVLLVCPAKLEHALLKWMICQKWMLRARPNLKGVSK